MASEKNKLAKESSPASSRPKLLWFHVFFVLPCIVLFIKGFASGSAGYLIIAWFLLPVSLVVLFLDVYYLLKRGRP